MSKYHINKHGVPAVCRATKGNCPLGGEGGSENHFDSLEEAQEYTDTQNELENNLLPEMNQDVSSHGNKEHGNREHEANRVEPSEPETTNETPVISMSLEEWSDVHTGHLHFRKSRESGKAFQNYFNQENGPKRMIALKTSSNDEVYAGDLFEDYEALSNEEKYRLITSLNNTLEDEELDEHGKLMQIENHIERYSKSIAHKKHKELRRNESQQHFAKLDNYLEKGEQIPKGVFSIDDGKTPYNENTEEDIVMKYGSNEQITEWKAIQADRKKAWRSSSSFRRQSMVDESRRVLTHKFNEKYGEIDTGNQREINSRIAAQREWEKTLKTKDFTLKKEDSLRARIFGL